MHLDTFFHYLCGGMKKNRFQSVGLGIFLALLSACAPQDREKPVIALENLTDSVRLATGDTLELHLRFSDNQKLAQYKIDIHEAFDGHTHGKIYRARPWSRIKIGDLSGTLQKVIEKIPVFDSAAAGPYHLIVRAVDAAGNEAEFLLKTLIVKNLYDTLAPEISPTDFPTDGQTLSGTVNLAVDISDNQSGIYIIRTSIRRSATQILYSVSDTLNDQPMTFSYTHLLNITTSMPPGPATLAVEVWDGTFNLTRLQKSVNLSP